MTLTCKIGKFIFDAEIPLHRAKLIRDTVMGMILDPKDGIRIKTSAEAYNFAVKAFPEDAIFLEKVVFTNKER